MLFTVYPSKGDEKLCKSRKNIVFLMLRSDGKSVEIGSTITSLKYYISTDFLSVFHLGKGNSQNQHRNLTAKMAEPTQKAQLMMIVLPFSFHFWIVSNDTCTLGAGNVWHEKKVSTMQFKMRCHISFCFGWFLKQLFQKSSNSQHILNKKMNIA